MWDIMGFRVAGFVAAVLVPLVLTATLFLGPISAIVLNGAWKVYLESSYWTACFQNILWIRNHIVAPLSEEFTFRACMMPLLLQSFRPMTAVLLTPLFFGVAHLHHSIERIRSGMDWKSTLIVSCKYRSGGGRRSTGRTKHRFKYLICVSRFAFCSLSICVHWHIWHLFGISVCKDRTLHCAIRRARILQPHGFSRYTGSIGAARQ